MNKTIIEAGTRLIGSAFRALRGIDFDALNQFGAALRADLDLISARDEDPTESRRVLMATISRELGAIDKRKKLGDNWNHAYRAEILIVSLYSAQKIDIELKRRLAISLRRKAPFSDFYRKAIETGQTAQSSTQPPQSKQADLLNSLVRDQQWLSSRQTIKMRYARLAIYKVGSVFVISFALFLGILATQDWVIPIQDKPVVEQGDR